MARIRLIEIAHARSGDKGDTANVGLIAKDPKFYPLLVSEVTAERVKQHFAGICHGKVERFEVPNLCALNFLLHESLDGGGTLALRADPQGKTYSSALLRMEIEAAEELVGPRVAATAPASVYSWSGMHHKGEVAHAFECIQLDLADGGAIIALNRPEKRNALSARLIAELKEALDGLKSIPEARVVLITGAGPDFCAGADLVEVRAMSESGVLENLDDARALGELFVAIRKFPKPVIAAVRGRAFAGGCGLATACDIVLAAESAQFGYTEVNLGFVPAMVMAILRRAVPEKQAFELIATGRILSAKAAHHAGLVNHVFDDASFDAEVDKFTAMLSSKPASALALSKRLLYQTDGMTFDASIEAGAQINAIARKTDALRDGLDRFMTRKA